VWSRFFLKKGKIKQYRMKTISGLLIGIAAGFTSCRSIPPQVELKEKNVTGTEIETRKTSSENILLGKASTSETEKETERETTIVSLTFTPGRHGNRQASFGRDQLCCRFDSFQRVIESTG
jgi:hypothetical protein